ncbi:hypothetical protein XELAEV_18004418mg [Xenopus laevis]|uniref:Uncharacterized protein n=1 Tax=Xenopus laevis TaxID=8355 RepID=A0A974BR91_XENLA|nr:hypothetical protein XELAEV_18004418mg [Xenopus laevis]
MLQFHQQCPTLPCAADPPVMLHLQLHLQQQCPVFSLTSNSSAPTALSQSFMCCRFTSCARHFTIVAPSSAIFPPLVSPLQFHQLIGLVQTQSIPVSLSIVLQQKQEQFS